MTTTHHNVIRSPATACHHGHRHGRFLTPTADIGNTLLSGTVGTGRRFTRPVLQSRNHYERESHLITNIIVNSITKNCPPQVPSPAHPVSCDAGTVGSRSGTMPLWPGIAPAGRRDRRVSRPFCSVKHLQRRQKESLPPSPELPDASALGTHGGRC